MGFTIKEKAFLLDYFRKRVKHKVTIRTGFTSTVLVFNTSVLDKQCTGFCPGFSRWQPIFLNCNKSISG
jgi:hypothetical protein